MKVFFLDTNVFLQCRDLKDLPWREIADGEDLLLLIPRTVQEEIDRQKSDGNTRRGKRARSASALFREIILTDDTKIVLSDSNPHVEVSFPDTKSSSSPASDFLDLSRPDDSIINELCLYHREHEALQVQLLTHDTNPMLTCKKIGVSFQAVPDAWLLPPEPDSKDKRITELEQKLRNIERSLPQIEVKFHDKDGVVVPAVGFDITTYTPLSETEVETLVSETCHRRPMHDNFDEPEPKRHLSPPFANSAISKHVLGFEWEYKKPTDKEIDEYRSVAYPKWAENLKAFYEKLPVSLGLAGHHLEIEIELSNNGSLPAEHLVLEIEAVGGLLLTKSESKDQLIGKTSTELPPEPVPPKGEWVQRKFGFNRFDLDPYCSALRVPDRLFDPIRNVAQKRDKNAFYRKGGNSGVYTKEWIFECDEFRHKVKPKVFKIFVLVPPKQSPRKGAISVTVTAKNMPEPHKVVLPITISYTTVETLEIARNLLPKPLPDFKFFPSMTRDNNTSGE